MKMEPLTQRRKVWKAQENGENKGLGNSLSLSPAILKTRVLNPLRLAPNTNGPGVSACHSF
jgi:hypothetical protein